jgi:hypothetical protein
LKQDIVPRHREQSANSSQQSALSNQPKTSCQPLGKKQLANSNWQMAKAKAKSKSKNKNLTADYTD